MADLYEQLKQQQLAIATKRIVRRQLSPGTTVLSSGSGASGAAGAPSAPGAPAVVAATSTQTFLVTGEAGVLRTTTPPLTGSPPWPPDLQSPPTTSASSYAANKTKYIGGDGGATYWVSVVLLSFDTSTLPDTAIVTGASLKLASGGTFDTENRSLMADWHVFGTPAQADWTALGVSGAISGVPISSIPANGPFEIQLENAPANVSKTGLTYLRLTINGGAPDAPFYRSGTSDGASANYVTIWGLGHETGVEEDGTPSPNTAARLKVSYA